MRLSDLNDRHYTYSQASRLLGIDRSTVREHCDAGRIATVKIQINTTRGAVKRTRIHWQALAEAARRLGYLEGES